MIVKLSLLDWKDVEGVKEGGAFFVLRYEVNLTIEPFNDLLTND